MSGLHFTFLNYFSSINGEKNARGYGVARRTNVLSLFVLFLLRCAFALSPRSRHQFSTPSTTNSRLIRRRRISRITARWHAHTVGLSPS